MKILRYKWLILIILLASVLGFWQLGKVPVSPDWDEVALGYNAYSILVTGKDEYGTRFPLSLRSYDDYKPPLYMYLATIPIKLFGLNVWAVRMPSAILGILSVIGTYVLVIELLQAEKIKESLRKLSAKKEIDKYIQSTALLSALLLVISPWHIQFSRIAFEANAGLTLNIWAIALFLLGLRKGKWLSMSAILAGLGFYAYHSERIFLPLLLLVMAFIFRKELMKRKKVVLLAMIVGAITIIPLVTIFLDKTTLMRLRGTSSLADQTLLLSRSVKKIEEDLARGDKIGTIFDNRRIVWAKTLIGGYLSHYSFRWLFLTGDNPRHHAPDIGLLYLWELPFLLWGMYTVAYKLVLTKKLLFSWFFIVPIAAAPTTELPHAIRTLVFLPTFQIFTAFGIAEFIHWHKDKSNVTKMIFLFVPFLVLYNIIFYFHMYFIHQNIEFSKFWQYGYEQAVDYTRQNRVKYRKIVVSTKLEQPHMFFLFYLKYDPKKYLKEGGTASGGFAEIRNKFDIYEFRKIDWNSELKDGQTLYIGLPDEIQGSIKKSIYYLDGSEAIRISDGV